MHRVHISNRGSKRGDHHIRHPCERGQGEEVSSGHKEQRKQTKVDEPLGFMRRVGRRELLDCFFFYTVALMDSDGKDRK